MNEARRGRLDVIPSNRCVDQAADLPWVDACLLDGGARRECAGGAGRDPGVPEAPFPDARELLEPPPRYPQSIHRWRDLVLELCRRDAMWR